VEESDKPTQEETNQAYARYLYETARQDKKLSNVVRVTTTGRKDDADKSRVDLLDTEWMEGVGEVLKFGAKKYAAHNWRGGIAISRLIASGLRHLFAFARGEDYDVESGLHHLLHASCCLMFAYWTVIHKPELDDRWKP
jgi:hypothetical protein